MATSSRRNETDLRAGSGPRATGARPVPSGTVSSDASSARANLWQDRAVRRAQASAQRKAAFHVSLRAALVTTRVGMLRGEV